MQANDVLLYGDQIASSASLHKSSTTKGSLYQKRGFRAVSEQFQFSFSSVSVISAPTFLCDPRFWLSSRCHTWGRRWGGKDSTRRCKWVLGGPKLGPSWGFHLRCWRATTGLDRCRWEPSTDSDVASCSWTMLQQILLFIFEIFLNYFYLTATGGRICWTLTVDWFRLGRELWSIQSGRDRLVEVNSYFIIMSRSRKIGFVYLPWTKSHRQRQPSIEMENIFKLPSVTSPLHFTWWMLKFQNEFHLKSIAAFNSLQLFILGHFNRNRTETLLNLRWISTGTALKLNWNCSETALKLLWNCSKVALKMAPL